MENAILTLWCLVWAILLTACPVLSTAEDNCPILTVNHSCSQSGESCITLQDGLQEVASWDPVSPPHDCVDLNLSPGEHVLSFPVAINGTNISFRLYGSGEAFTSIKCADSITYTDHYSLRLDKITSAVFEGISVLDCGRPIQVSNTRNVSIISSSFRRFTAGALDVYNCLHVKVMGSTFANNTAVALITDVRFRGNAGGIAIGINDHPFNSSDPSITIQNCTFCKNMATPTETESTTQLYTHQIVVGRGGGAGIYILENTRVSATIEDCSFEENVASTFGGGLYIILGGEISNHSIHVRRSQFTGNEAELAGGGGLHIGYLVSFVTLHSAVIADCTFVANKARFGGGSYILPGLQSRIGVSVLFTRCNFTHNLASRFGSALGLPSVDFFEPRFLQNPYKIEDCIFEGNKGGSGGVVGICYSPVLMRGYTHFSHNSGTVLKIIGGTLTLQGRLDFIENFDTTTNGAALYLTSYGQTVMQEGAEMNFIGNTASIGAAIVVETQSVVSELQRVAFNPLCFIRYGPAPFQSPLNWEKLRITFSQNSALIAPVLFINQLDLCSWFQFEPPYFNRSGVLRWPFINITGDNSNVGHTGYLKNDPSLYIQTPAVDLQVYSSNISAHPGEPLNISAEALDELGNPTASFIRFSDLVLQEASGKGEVRRYHFRPQLARYRPDLEFETVSYATNMDDFEVNSTVRMSLFGSLPAIFRSKKVEIPFTAEHCPFGSKLILRTRNGTGVSKVCLCNTVNNPSLIQCEPNSNDVIFAPHMWVTAITDSIGITSLKGHRCPLNYCRVIHNTTLGEFTYGSVYSPSKPDQQCACDRRGILCGKCPEDFGVSILLNRCTACNSGYISLLVILVIAVMLVCVGLVLLSKPLPPWIYPCIFYLQILPFNAVNFPLSFGVVHRLPLYFSSLSSLYFPYDFCLHRNLTTILSYLFRYLPLFTVIPTTVITLMVKQKKFRPVPWYGVWTLVIFMYSAIVHTSITILHCSVLDKFGMRWYVSGNIKCFEGAHGALAALAMVILFFAVIFIPFIAFVTWKNPGKPRCLRYVIPPLTYAFKPKLYWWGSIELTRRLLVLIFSVPFPGNPIAPAYIFMISATVHLFVQPYKSRLANILEAVLSVDAILLLLMGSNRAIVDELVLDNDSNLTQVIIVFATPDYCSNLIRGATKLTLALGPVFYLPMVTFLTGIAATLIFYLQAWCRKYYKGYKERLSRRRQFGYASFLELTTETNRAPDFTVTSVRLSDF